jgi:hypothetical protein
MKTVKYDETYKTLWNDFVKKAKNSHFFFYRDYMEYHSDRFKDFSLLFFDEKDKLIALFPGNIKNNIVYSHQGLTFGGFLTDSKMKTRTMLDIFDALKKFLINKNIEKLIYKCIPYIYHRLPAEEDRYALFVNNAKLFRRDVTVTIDLTNKIKYQEQRKRALKKALKNNITVEYSNDYEKYWKILEKTLKNRHNSKPVHSVNEIVRLHNLFPENIKLFVAKKDNEILAGTVVFENEHIVHTQYLANSEEGKKLGALDLVLDKLINDIYKNKKYFDFGISNENNGLYLNEGLINQKEGFGARAVVHDFYELDLKNNQY